MVLETDAAERATAARALFDPKVDAPPEVVEATRLPEVVEATRLPEVVEATRPPVSASPAVVVTAPAPVGPVAVAVPPASRDERRVGVALAAGIGVESAVASSLAWGGSAGVAIQMQPQRSSWWAPALQAEVFATFERTEQAPVGGNAELQLLTGRVHACPLSVPLTSRARFSPCLTGDVGSLRARGAAEARNPETQRMPWLALGATVSSQVALGGGFTLQSALAARGLARADRFVFREDYTAYKVPAWSLGVSLGVALALR
jgi:hypothetical protein